MGYYLEIVMKFILRNWFNHHTVLNGHHSNPDSFFKLFCHQLFCQFFIIKLLEQDTSDLSRPFSMRIHSL